MATIQKILFPTDFHQNSSLVSSYVLSIAEKFDASIDVIHVLQQIVDITDEYHPVFSYDEIATEMEKIARQKIDAFIKNNIGSKAPCEGRLKWGTPFNEIIKAGRELSSDIIIMGTHGRTGLNHILFGSTAEKVVRKAPIPVLTVRNSEVNFEMP